MKSKYLHILSISLIVLLLIPNCKNIDKTVNDNKILKIGNFIVSKEEFDNAVSEIEESNPSLTKDEIELTVFDNFIGLGLLAELAKQKKYERSIEFKAKYEEYLKQWRIKFNKYLRARKHAEDNKNYNKAMEYQDVGITVDYIRVAKGQKQLAKKMFDFFNSGVGFSDIKANPEYEEWLTLGVSFNEGIALSSVVFTKKTFDQIAPFNDGRVEFIKERSSYYIIRTNRTGELPCNIKNKNIYFLNTMMAENIEHGDLTFDPFVLESKIKCSQSLLSAIDFAFPPLNKDTTYNNEIIADLNGVKIYASEIKQKISNLPVEYQNLFINKSTRKKAIASLILINYSSSVTKPNTDSKLIYSNFEMNLKQSIQFNRPIDTIEFIKKWIIDQNNNTLAISYNNRTNKTIVLSNKNKQNDLPQRRIVTIDEWLNPTAYLYSNVLYLNYGMIDTLNLKYDISEIKNSIIASSSNWNLRVDDLIKELKKLTSETRIEIAKRNQSIDLVKYIAIRDAKTKKVNIKINLDVLSKISIAGNSYDNTMPIVNEYDTVGSLNSTILLVRDLRPIVELLPQKTKEKKLIKIEDKLNIFNKIISDHFWANLYDNKELNSNYEYNMEKEYYRYILLAQLYYNNEIKFSFYEQIVDNDLKLKYNTAVGIINKEKLNSLIAEASLIYPIEVNVDLLKDNYKFNLLASMFNKNIKIINHKL